MKIFSKILALSLVIAALVSCSSDCVPVNNSDISLDPNQKYIHFDTDILTRGNLISGDVLQDGFSVLGYSYLGSWSGNSAMIKPNVFDDTPQKVEFENGIYTYSNEPKGWTGNTYSFFGYYPAEHDKIKLFDNGSEKTGEPYITYELASRNNPVPLIDVMTASCKDTNVSSSSTVALHFYHRLAAIDVAARNYYEYDHDGESDTEKVPVTIEITELTVHFTNLVNQKAKIYFDRTKPSVYTAESENNRTANYPMVGKNQTYTKATFDINPNTVSDRDMRFISTQDGNNASALLVIPQEEELHISSTLKYKKKYKVGEEWVYIPNIDANGNNTGDEFSEPLSVTFTKKIQEGRRYYIELTFTSDAVSINVVAADEWNELDDDIAHEFA